MTAIQQQTQFQAMRTLESLDRWEATICASYRSIRSTRAPTLIPLRSECPGHCSNSEIS